MAYSRDEDTCMSLGAGAIRYMPSALLGAAAGGA
jgi:hypothetical protein